MIVIKCEDCGKERNHNQTKARPAPKKCWACSMLAKGGALNGRWQGGITRRSGKGRSTKAYKQWRNTVFECDHFTCVLCGSKENLHADHIKAYCEHPELRLDLSNGRTLCLECHKKTDNYLSKALLGRKMGPSPLKKTHCQCGKEYDYRRADGVAVCVPCQRIRQRRGDAKRIGIRRGKRKKTDVQDVINALETV